MTLITFIFEVQILSWINLRMRLYKCIQRMMNDTIDTITLILSRSPTTNRSISTGFFFIFINCQFYFDAFFNVNHTDGVEFLFRYSLWQAYFNGLSQENYDKSHTIANIRKATSVSMQVLIIVRWWSNHTIFIFTETQRNVFLFQQKHAFSM